MRNDVDFFDVEGVEQGGGVAGELIEVKIGEGLRRFAEADLVRDHDEPSALSGLIVACQ